MKTGMKVRSYEEMDDEAVDRIIDEVNETFLSWREADFEQRAALMTMAAQILCDRENDLSALMTEKRGKALAEGVGENEKYAWVFVNL